MKTRIKKTGSAGSMSRAEMEAQLSQVRDLTISRSQLLAEKNAALKELDEQFSPRLNAWEQAIQEKTVLIQAWAEANPEEFAKRKSIELAHGTIGFRTGTPKLKTLAKQTWAKVLDTLRASPFAEKFIRIKEEVDKESLLVAHANFSIDDAGLRGLGLEVTQEESFFITPKLEEADIRQIAEVTK